MNLSPNRDVARRVRACKIALDEQTMLRKANGKNTLAALRGVEFRRFAYRQALRFLTRLVFVIKKRTEAILRLDAHHYPPLEHGFFWWGYVVGEALHTNLARYTIYFY